MFAYGKVNQVQQVQHGVPRKRQIVSDVYQDRRPNAPQKWHHQQGDLGSVDGGGIGGGIGIGIGGSGGGGVNGAGGRPEYGARQSMSGVNLWGGDTQPIFELGDFGGSTVTGQPHSISDDRHGFGAGYGGDQPEHRYQDDYDEYGAGQDGYQEHRCNPHSLLSGTVRWSCLPP